MPYLNEKPYIKLAQLALLLVLFTCAITTSASPLHLGSDIPFYYYEDKDGTLTFEQFKKISFSELSKQDDFRSFGYSRSAFWIRFTLPEHIFQSSDRWLKLGPNFLDNLTLYYRPLGFSEPWIKHEAGDLHTGTRGDLDYRFPVFILSPPAISNTDQNGGYDVIIRIASTSAVMLSASLWSAAEFSKHAATESSFWSFYFGLALISCTIALTLALLLRKRLFWSIFLFSLTSFLVACVEGYVAWIFGSTATIIQHFLTSILTLLAYTSLLWMCTEIINIRKHLPVIHKIIISTVALNITLQLSIPLDFYELAIKIQGIILIPSALIFTYALLVFCKNEKPKIYYVFVGLLPLIYMTCAILALASLHGLIPFKQNIYVAWQYIVLANMVLVLWLSTSQIVNESRRANEHKLIERKLKLESDANRNQRQFIGIVSHEFRTPLSIISATLQNLQMMTYDQQITLRYNKIQRATERLVQLTDNCLADARLEGTELSIQAEPIDLTSLLMDVSMSIEQSEKHQLQLSLHGRPLSSCKSLPETLIVADRAMLRIALSNLIDNALKYAPSGIILIDISSKLGQVSISIEDQGPGIPAEQEELIFERYRRLELSTKERSSGTGLGLYVARQIIRRHGGDIRLTTFSPQGCRFELTLPV